MYVVEYFDEFLHEFLSQKQKNNHYERFKFNMYLRMWRTQFSLLFLRPTNLTFVCRRLCLPCRRKAWTNRLTITAKTLFNRTFHVITPHTPTPAPLQCCPQTLTWIKEYNGPLRRQFHNLCWLAGRKAPPSPSQSLTFSLKPPPFSSFTRFSSPSSCPPAGSRRRVKPAWTHCDCHSGTD